MVALQLIASGSSKKEAPERIGFNEYVFALCFALAASVRPGFFFVLAPQLVKRRTRELPVANVKNPAGHVLVPEAGFHKAVAREEKFQDRIYFPNIEGPVCRDLIQRSVRDVNYVVVLVEPFNVLRFINLATLTGRKIKKLVKLGSRPEFGFQFSNSHFYSSRAFRRHFIL
jgi:hypothetical protein